MHEIGEVDDDVAVGANRTREGASPHSLRRSILVPGADEGRSFFVVCDDRGNLPNTTVMWKADGKKNFLDFTPWRPLMK
jgi:hypothetical protein